MSSSLNEFDSIWAPPDRAVDDKGVVHDKVQAALDNANDFVIVGPGTFEENIVIEDVGMTVRGSGRGTVIDGGEAGHAITCDADRLEVEQIAAKTTPGTDNDNVAFRVNDSSAGNVLRLCRGVDGDGASFEIIGDETKLIGCVSEATDNTGIRFSTSADSCAAVGCTVQDGVSNNGIRINASRSVAVGCSIEGVGGWGLVAAGVDGAFIGNTSYDVGQDGFLFLSGSDRTLGIGNVIKNPAADFVNDDDAPDSIQLIGNNPASANTPVGESSDLTDAGYVSRLVDSPNATFHNVIIDDGDTADKTVPVADGETIKVYRWGAYQISDGSTPADLDMELVDGSGTVVATENTGDTESTDPSSPVASDENTSGSTSIYSIKIANDTGSTIDTPGVGGFAAFIVE